MKKTEAKAIETAKHMIGMDYKKPYKRHGRMLYRPYRNFFAAGRGGEPELDWLVSQGRSIMRVAEPGIHGSNYYLTRDGLDWLGDAIGVHIYDEER